MYCLRDLNMEGELVKQSSQHQRLLISCEIPHLPSHVVDLEDLLGKFSVRHENPHDFSEVFLISQLIHLINTYERGDKTVTNTKEGKKRSEEVRGRVWRSPCRAPTGKKRQHFLTGRRK